MPELAMAAKHLTAELPPSPPEIAVVDPKQSQSYGIRYFTTP